jgi:hypothetical protein
VSVLKKEKEKVSLVSKTGYEKGVKRVSVFDEMRVKLKPQPIINGDHNDTHRQSF